MEKGSGIQTKVNNGVINHSVSSENQDNHRISSLQKRVSAVIKDPKSYFSSELRDCSEGRSTQVQEKKFTLSEDGKKTEHSYFIRELEREEDHFEYSNKDIYEYEINVLNRLFSDVPNRELPKNLAMPVAFESEFDEEDMMRI